MYKLQCPACKGEFDMPNPVRTDEHLKRQPATPEPHKGDHTCCMLCGALLVNAETGWQELSDEEWIALSLDERKMIKRFQEVILARINGKKPEKAGEALNMPLHLLPDEVLEVLPWIIGKKVLADKVGDKLLELVNGGLAYTVRQILTRDTPPEEDLKCLVPLVLASVLIRCEGDRDKAMKEIDAYIAKNAPNVNVADITI